jgi:hypothetical protein
LAQNLVSIRHFSSCTVPTVQRKIVLLTRKFFWDPYFDTDTGTTMTASNSLDLPSTGCADNDCINRTLMMFTRRFEAFKARTYRKSEPCLEASEQSCCDIDPDQSDCDLCGQEGGEEGNQLYRDMGDRSTSCPRSIHPSCVSYQKSEQGLRPEAGEFTTMDLVIQPMLTNSGFGVALQRSVQATKL